MTILGLDPGTARIGWGIISENHGAIRYIACGLITTTNSRAPEHRLVDIYDSIHALCHEYHPDIASIEQLFFMTNVKTAFAVGQARGVILCALAQENIPTYSYNPRSIKLAVAGHGRADKPQVQEMVKRTLNLTKRPQPDDVADALALALTHAFTYKMDRTYL